MTIKTISASFSAKKQLQQYEPIEVFMSAEAEVEAAGLEEMQLEQDQLFRFVKEGVKRQLKEILKGGDNNG